MATGMQELPSEASRFHNNHEPLSLEAQDFIDGPVITSVRVLAHAGRKCLARTLADIDDTNLNNQCYQLEDEDGDPQELEF